MTQGSGSLARPATFAVVVVFLALGGTAAALPGKNTVDSGDIKNGEVRDADVETDGLTGSAIDEGTLHLPWDQLTGVPAGFADGVDNVGSGGGDATDLHCPGACIEASEIGDGQVVGTALRLPFNVVGARSSGPVIDVTNSGATSDGPTNATAVRASAPGNGIGLDASAGTFGVRGEATNNVGIGVQGIARGPIGIALRGDAPNGGWAARLYGRVEIEGSTLLDGATEVNDDLHVSGTLSKSAGSFRIDHPLDPENKYLQHSFVESPEMMNIYNGVVTTDERGYATVEMPDWFEALNRDFRYQLTPMHSFARSMVSREIERNSFEIRTSKPRTKVSWQVTGVRHDTYAKANPIEVEVAK